MKGKVVSVVLVAALAGVMLAGCGSDSSSSSSTEETSASSEETSYEGVTLNIASVNNDSMVVMEELTSYFTEETGIEVNYTILSENEIRSKIQEDVALGGGTYDLVTLGTSDMATYYSSGWTISLDDLFAELSDEELEEYDLDDIIPSVYQSNCDASTGTLVSLPFYSESTMICYNTEIFEEKGLTMPENPTWDDILELAKAADDPDAGISGIALRGLAGYGENNYTFGSIMYAFGGQYYDTDWNATYDTEEVRNAWEFYYELMQYAEDSPTTCGYTECLNLFAQGQAAIYFDATVSASTFAGEDSEVAGKVGYAMTPTEVSDDTTGTIGGWGISITSGSENVDAAFEFLRWCTSKEYIELVQEVKGYTYTPSGTRISTYENEEYLEACDFAEMTYESINAASIDHPAVNDTPYTGNSLPNLSEYSSWGETIAAELSAYISDQGDLDSHIATCQDAIDTAAEEGGYRD